MKKLILAGLLFYSLSCIAQQVPSIDFTHVPGWGQQDLLHGTVHNVTPADHGVTVYIFLEEAGGWWTKPFSANPVTSLLPDSTFTADIVTGGIDAYATRIMAFLIPLTYSPPVLEGGEIPVVLLSYPHVIACRPHGDRRIFWSGFEWTVKRSVGSPPLPMGPGPNVFSDSDSSVWVDALQRLHLRVFKSGSTWTCAEMICSASLGFGRYEFETGSRTDLFDPNVIAGFFTWDDGSPYALPPDAFYREIDVECSRWGIPGNDNTQFVVQPYSIPGNIHRFNMALEGAGISVHSFDWSADSIALKARGRVHPHPGPSRTNQEFPSPERRISGSTCTCYSGIPRRTG